MILCAGLASRKGGKPAALPLPCQGLGGERQRAKDTSRPPPTTTSPVCYIDSLCRQAWRGQHVSKGQGVSWARPSQQQDHWHARGQVTDCAEHHPA